MGAFLKKVWTKVIKPGALELYKVIYNVLKQMYSTITDHKWDVDVFRIGGIAAYIVAGKIALQAATQVIILNEAKLGILAGLVSAIAGIGTMLFSQSRKHDDVLAGKP